MGQDRIHTFDREARRAARELRAQARELLRRARAEERARRRERTGGERRWRKERTLQVRVPGGLFQAVAAEADRHGRTISEEIRDCLADHYGVAPQLPPIIGWQPFSLAMPAACEGCRAVHHAGDPMFVAITRDDRARLLVCAACKARVEARPPSQE